MPIQKFTTKSEFFTQFAGEASLAYYRKLDLTGKTNPIQEVNAEVYDYMLECLPPANWEQVGGVERFTMIEMSTGDLTRMFAKTKRLGVEERFFTKEVNIRDRSTWITLDMIVTQDAEPTPEGEPVLCNIDGEVELRKLEERDKEYATMLHRRCKDPLTTEELATAIDRTADMHNSSWNAENAAHDKSIWDCATEVCKDRPDLVALIDFLLTSSWNDILAWCEGVLKGNVA